MIGNATRERVDARTATPTQLSFDILEKIVAGILARVPNWGWVTCNIAPKPPSTIEAV